MSRSHRFAAFDETSPLGLFHVELGHMDVGFHFVTDAASLTAV